jgi:hypothetical protein
VCKKEIFFSIKMFPLPSMHFTRLKKFNKIILSLYLMRLQPNYEHLDWWQIERKGAEGENLTLLHKLASVEMYSSIMYLLWYLSAANKNIWYKYKYEWHVWFLKFLLTTSLFFLINICISNWHIATVYVCRCTMWHFNTPYTMCNDQIGN